MPSLPPAPSSEPPNKKQCRFKDFGFPCEWVEDYRPGGFHPVHFGDQLKDGRYKIIRKVGDGSFSTVWLAVDNSDAKYVALKILRSSSSGVSAELSIHSFLNACSDGDPLARHVALLLDSFQIEGPNGSHRCLIFEPMGPSVVSMVEHLPRNKNRKFNQPARYGKDVAKKILIHAISGLAYLHKHGIVHGDVQGGNMLFSIPGLDSVDEESLEHNRSKISKPLVRRDGKTDLWGPKYLATSQPLDEYVDLGPNLMVKVSDIGSAFWKDKPPRSTVTPIALRAPELIFEESFGTEIDIWAIGCLIYELLIGLPLFGVVMIGDDKLEDANDDHILDLIDVLGPLPAHLMSKWPRKDKWIGNDGERLQPRGDDDGLDYQYDPETDSEPDSETASDESNNELLNETDFDGTDMAGEPPGSPIIIEGLPSDFETSDGPVIVPSLEEQFEKQKPDGMDAKETSQVTELIREILRYDPSERPTATQLLQHPWFCDT